VIVVGPMIATGLETGYCCCCYETAANHRLDSVGVLRCPIVIQRCCDRDECPVGDMLVVDLKAPIEELDGARWEQCEGEHDC